MLSGPFDSWNFYSILFFISFPLTPTPSSVILKIRGWVGQIKVIEVTDKKKFNVVIPPHSQIPQLFDRKNDYSLNKI